MLKCLPNRVPIKVKAAPNPRIEKQSILIYIYNLDGHITNLIESLTDED